MEFSKTLFLDISLDPISNIEEILCFTSSTVSNSNNDIPQSNNLVLQKDFKDNYNEYTILDSHIGFSDALFRINSQGNHLINELKNKKNVLIPGDSLAEKAYFILKSVIKDKTFGTSNLMNELLYLLDELMIEQVKEITHFYIDDDEFPITKVYYGQKQWIGEDDEFVQKYELVKATDGNLEEGEIMLLLCFLTNYLTITENIILFLDSEKCTHIHDRLEMLLVKIENKLSGLKTQLYDIINKSL